MSTTIKFKVCIEMDPEDISRYGSAEEFMEDLNEMNVDERMEYLIVNKYPTFSPDKKEVLYRHGGPKATAHAATGITSR